MKLATKNFLEDRRKRKGYKHENSVGGLKGKLNR
jgi:hypothetical protein